MHKHRLGAILMIVGVNIVVGSFVAAFWRASYGCAVKAVDGSCPGGVLTELMQLLISAGGVGYWIFVGIGVFVFWRGKRIRYG